MKKGIRNFRLIVIIALLAGSAGLKAQQAPEQMEDIFEQMEQMMQEFSQGSFMQLDSMMMPGFGSMQGFGSMPGFFFSDTLLMDSDQFQGGYGMDIEGLMQELSRSFENMDPQDLQEMEDLMKQFKFNGIPPDEENTIPKDKPKKKKKVYKI